MLRKHPKNYHAHGREKLIILDTGVGATIITILTVSPVISTVPSDREFIQTCPKSAPWGEGKIYFI